MLYDMGFNISIPMSQDYVEHAIADMDSFFDLVLIVEKMDESLILLKDHLCWEYSDIVFLNKNARRGPFVASLSEEQIQTLEELNKEDVMLYQHFLRKHEVEVDNFGREKMAEEVAKLAGLRQNVTDECNIKTVKGKVAKGKFEEYSEIVDAFVLDDESDEQCLLMSLPELELLDKIRDRQLERLS